MKGRWAAGIVPRNFSWVITDHLAVAERPGGSAPQHRRVRRREEILWLRAQGFTKVVSLLPSSHNLHAYEELDVPYEHVPMGLHDDPTKSLAELYPALLAWLYGGERILIHQDELSERLAGVLAGFLWWSGMLPEAPLAISAIEQLLRRQLGSIGRTIVTLAVDVAPPGEADLRRPERAAATRLVAARLRELEEARSAEAELAGDLLLLRADAVEAERAKSHDASTTRPAKRAARDKARPEEKRPTKAPSKARPSAKVIGASPTRPAPRSQSAAGQGQGEESSGACEEGRATRQGCEVGPRWRFEGCAATRREDDGPGDRAPRSCGETRDDEVEKTGPERREVNEAIEVRGLRVLGTHGALEEEQRRPQPFEIDLVVETQLVGAARSDDVRDAVDYGPIVVSVRDLVATTRFQLLEALADAVATEVLADPRIDAVTVCVRKLRPPVAADVDSIGVRVTRRRDASVSSAS